MLEEGQSEKPTCDGGEIKYFEKHLEILLNYCWSWHELYTNQRLITLRFYLIFVGAYFAAYYVLISNGEFIWAIGLSSGSLIFNICFWWIERRNVNLIVIGEEALRLIEEKLQERTKLPTLMLVSRGRESGKHRLQRSSHVITVVFVVTSAFMLIGVFHPRLSPQISRYISTPHSSTLAEQLDENGGTIGGAVGKRATKPIEE